MGVGERLEEMGVDCCGGVSCTWDMDTRLGGERTVMGSGTGHGGERPCGGEEIWSEKKALRFTSSIYSKAENGEKIKGIN